MKRIKQGYNYFFYKIYKSTEYTSEMGGGKFWSDWKAGIILDLLCFFLCFSILIYYKIIENNHQELGNAIIFMGLLFIVIPNYFIFHHQDKWKRIITDFDKLPKKKNSIGTWIVFGIVLLIIGNFIFSFYCLDQQARKDQIGPYTPEIVAKERREDSLRKAQQI
ncbi:hypothetical protein, partial [Chryseobacterium vrystaatense]